MGVANSALGRWIFKTSTTSDGGELVQKMVTDEAYQKTNGMFYVDGKLHKEPEEVLSKENQEEMWTLCEKYTH